MNPVKCSGRGFAAAVRKQRPHAAGLVRSPKKPLERGAFCHEFCAGRAKNRRRLCVRPAGNELTSSSFPARPPRRRRPEKVHASRVAAEEKGPPVEAFLDLCARKNHAFCKRPQVAENIRLTEGVKPRDFSGRKPKQHRAARGKPVGFPLRSRRAAAPLREACGKRIYFVVASCTATAQATVMPTMGLLPAPIRPIISTCAGTEEEPANCASECMRPIVSVMP